MFGGVVNPLAKSTLAFGFDPLVKKKACFRAFWTNFSHDHDHLNLSEEHLVKVAV
jgi:hypothetical protein